MQRNANECKHNGKLTQWKANSTEHKCIGMQMQQNANVKAMEWLCNETQKKCYANLSSTQMQRNANATECKRKWCSTQTERELFYDRYSMSLSSTKYAIVTSCPKVINDTLK